MRSFASRLIPLAIASIILCGVTLAGGGKGDAHLDDHIKLMQRMLDKNSDGKITAAEYMQAEKNLFNRIDTNEDGFVSVQELAVYDQSIIKGKAHATAASAVEQIAKMDIDDDGKVSAAEWDAAAKQRFAQMDGDGDGTLTAQELRAGERAMMASDE